MYIKHKFINISIAETCAR